MKLLPENFPGRSAVREFRGFILRGSIVDLAVAVVVGTAFTAVVNAFVRDVVTPMIAVVTDGHQGELFADLRFSIRGSEFPYGDLINSILTFVIISVVVFFMVVKPANAIMRRLVPLEEPDAPTKACPFCLNQVPQAAVRCGFCASNFSSRTPIHLDSR